MNKTVVYEQLQLCRNELLMMQYNQLNPWSVIRTWEAKWKPWFRVMLPMFIDDFSILLQEPKWKNMRYSVLRATEDTTRFSGINKPQEWQIFGDTLLESLQNTNIWTEERNKLFAFLDGVKNAIDSMDLDIKSGQAVSDIPTRRSILRKIIRENIRSDSDLEAFCLDYFPNSQRKFSSSMDTEQKINLLLEQEDSSSVVQRLRERFKEVSIPARFDALP